MKCGVNIFDHQLNIFFNCSQVYLLKFHKSNETHHFHIIAKLSVNKLSCEREKHEVDFNFNILDWIFRFNLFVSNFR